MHDACVCFFKGGYSHYVARIHSVITITIYTFQSDESTTNPTTPADCEEEHTPSPDVSQGVYSGNMCCTFMYTSLYTRCIF